MSNEKKNLLDDVYFSKDFQLSEEFEKAKKYLSNLDLTVNSLGLVAGCLIVFWGITCALSSTFAMNPLAMIADIFLSIFGFTMCVLEMKEKSFSKKFLKWIEREIHLLFTPYGRSGLYMLAGIFLISRNSGFFPNLTGIFTIFVGGLASWSTKVAYDTLGLLLDEQYTEETISAKFDEFDNDNSGDLDIKEMHDLCKSLSKTMSDAQLEAAIYALDQNQSGKIDKTEFIEWWRAAKEDKKKGGMLAFIKSVIPFKIPF